MACTIQQLQQASYTSPSLRIRSFCFSSGKSAIPLTLRRGCDPPLALAAAEVSPSQQTDSANKQNQQQQRSSHRPSDTPPRPRPPSKPRVGIFWDLDNKPPRIEAYDVAMDLKKLSEEFGEVVEMVAYANQHVFKFIPMYVREARQKRKELDQLEADGVVQPSQPYLCKICQQKFPIHMDLQSHILTFHEPGRQRVARLLSSEDLTEQQKESLEAKRKRYMEGSRKVVVPAVGYDLDYELERAGVLVGLVTDDPQAADTALKECMWKSLNSGKIDCFVLVSDDTDYENVLVEAGKKGLHRVVLAETIALQKSVDVWLSWFQLMTGEAQIAAAEAAKEYLCEYRRLRRKPFQRADQITSKGKFLRVWRRTTTHLPKEDHPPKGSEGKNILQLKHVSSFFLSYTDSVQQLG